ncbi:MAG: hypothetical protein IT370_09835 [Deltaproteobacteria bacterium]|nr:hypothetical protein [Deltaproteobacteria bacterium]
MAQTARVTVVMLGAALALLAGCTRERHDRRPPLPSPSETPVPVPEPTLPAPTASPVAPAPELACVAVMSHCACKFICVPANDRPRTDCARACPQERSATPPKCSGQSGKCEIVP